MRMSGIGRGSRSGVAIQRGRRAIELGNFHIDGVKNSPIDMEPSGANPLSMAHLNIHDGFIDQSLGQSDVAVAISGISHGPRAQHVHVSDVTIVDGRVLVISTDGLRVRNVTVVAALASKSPVFAVRQVNIDLRLENLCLERLAGSVDGNVLDVENAGSSTTIEGGVFKSGVGGRPMTFDGSAGLCIHGAQIQYDAPGPGSRDGINVVAGIGNADRLHIGDVRVTSSTGKLHSAVRLAARAGRSMTSLRVKDVQCAGSATPIVEGIDNGNNPVWKRVDQNDNSITTAFPVISGNPGDVCELVGQCRRKASLQPSPELCSHNRTATRRAGSTSRRAPVQLAGRRR